MNVGGEEMDQRFVKKKHAGIRKETRGWRWRERGKRN